MYTDLYALYINIQKFGEFGSNENNILKNQNFIIHEYTTTIKSEVLN